jgi:cyclopropane-fatty-acyl-phospholipid synthase
VTSKAPNIWLEKYIFPNSYVPSIQQVGRAIEGLFVMEDWHNFGADYDKTTKAWYQNFEKAWPKLKKNYSQTFYRMWRLYLLSCAGSFRARGPQLWQIVLSPKGVAGGYHSVR